jgi:DNA-directed RNA polymerase subunit M/transcription elongation factor TFIIS
MRQNRSFFRRKLLRKLSDMKRCPSCGAMMYPLIQMGGEKESTICASCNVNLTELEESLQKLIEEQAKEKEKEMTKEAEIPVKIDDEVRTEENCKVCEPL